MQNTSLSVKEISTMLGCGNHSNFYKAFKGYYGTMLREYISGNDNN